MTTAFFRTKKFYALVVGVLLVSYVGYRQYQKANQPPAYDTVAVVQGKLVQTVSATGKLEAVDDLSLRFETPGTVGVVKVKEGDTVTAGTELASLRIADLDAAVARASADLNQKLAGASTEDRAYYAAAVSSAQAALEQSKVDTAAAIASAETDVFTARNNLKLAEGGEGSQIVSKAYDDGVVVLQGTLTKLDDALLQIDSVVGVDETLANDSFEQYLGNRNSQTITLARDAYVLARITRDAARKLSLPLSTLSAHADVDLAFVAMESALNAMNRALVATNDLLQATTYSSTALDTRRTTITTNRTTITTQYTTVIAQRQAIADAKNSYSSYQFAFDKAQRALEQAKANASTIVASKQALYDQAQATYESKVNKPREVDVAAYRAALAQATANRNKGVIRAPIDGVVTKINKKPGELITSGEVMMQLLSPHYEVSVDIPETEVAKVTGRKQNQAILTFDAFGDETKFTGDIVSIDKSSTEIQDVVYYKVKISLTGDYSTHPVKPGMTVNVDIVTDMRDSALSIPTRAVRTVDGQKQIQLLDGKTVKDVPVTLGMRADDGRIEVINGLTAGQLVILGKK